ncbi:quercetin dioxygenase-like cupin family protein [Paraburkholderia sp. GAS334]|jgi:quercetin dioxygenase-like cupin family protein
MRIRRAVRRLAIIVCLPTALVATESMSAPVVPGGCETPVSQRTNEVGCYLTATEDLGEVPQGPLFWHLYNYPTRAAADAAKGSRATVVESFGRVWLYTIADAAWRPSGGERIAVIGPLATIAGKRYTARYMEVVFTPGMVGGPHAHRHPGAEAWYVLTGAQCLETPEGITVLHAGESGTVAEGPPMYIQSVGTEIRRSVLLVLHDSSQPWISAASDWTPKGLCPK